MGTPRRFLSQSLPAALVALIVGCAGGELPGDDGSPSTSSATEALKVKSQRIWVVTPTPVGVPPQVRLPIPVCWENPDNPTNNATERGWVQNKIANTWSANSYVAFTGWGTCSPGASGIHIRIADEQPRVVMLGRDLNGFSNGMVLNFAFNSFAPGCASQRQNCIEQESTHIFGHALGFADDPQTCADSPTDGDATTIGSGEPQSIMNCPFFGNVMTANDIKGLQQYYGSPTFASNRKAAVVWPNNKIYFFNSSQYTSLDMSSLQADSGYPLNIGQFWGNGSWPPDWNDGVDAAFDNGDGKAYFFRGPLYLRYDIASERVDPTYPKPIIGNWANWPTSTDWLNGVDAAVKWSNGKIYFFRGQNYLRFDVATNRVDPGYPTAIAPNWPGLLDSNFDGIDYSIALPNGSLFFFRGLQYKRFNFAANQVPPGYPMPIAGNWPGVPF